MGKRKARNDDDDVEDTAVYKVERILEHRRKGGRVSCLPQNRRYARVVLTIASMFPIH